jgi:hypothetical protein
MFPNTPVVLLIPARGITTFQAQHGQHVGSAPDTRNISGAARPTCSDRACPCQDHSQALVILLLIYPPAFHEASSQATFTTLQ